MSKLKIDKGASRIRRVSLKTTIDGTVADDVELMCQWSENQTSYIVNHLLRFALSQSEDFQRYKESLSPKGQEFGAVNPERSTVSTSSQHTNKESR